MTIWSHIEYRNDLVDWRAQHPTHCPHCVSQLDLFDVIPILEKIGFRPCATDPDGGEIETELEGAEAGCCKGCGWWAISTAEVCDAVNYDTVVHSTAGMLRGLEIADISTPLTEARQFLAAKYDSRFDLHPRLMEEIVASVFHDHGYDSMVTAYSNDGGIDAVLIDPSGISVGVQVKRYKNRINVEQIRAFLGALVLGGYTKGIFVSTSSFTRPAMDAAGLSRQAAATQIELVDSNKFLEALKIAQHKAYTRSTAEAMIVDALSKDVLIPEVTSYGYPYYEG
jgi:restriction system protein